MDLNTTLQHLVNEHGMQAVLAQCAAMLRDEQAELTGMDDCEDALMADNVGAIAGAVAKAGRVYGSLAGVIVVGPNDVM